MAVIFGPSCFLFKKILSSLSFIFLFFKARTAGRCEDYIHINLYTFTDPAHFTATVSTLLLPLFTLWFLAQRAQLQIPGISKTTNDR